MNRRTFLWVFALPVLFGQNAWGMVGGMARKHIPIGSDVELDAEIAAKGGGGGQPTLPLNLGPGLFVIDAKGRIIATTDADFNSESGLVLSVKAGPNALANAGEVFQVIDENGQQRFGVDAEGGTAINTDTLPYGSRFGVLTDAMDPGNTYVPILKAGSDGVELTALTGLTVRITDINEDPILEADSTGKLGFFGHAPVARPTGVAVDAAAIHAALVSLGLITA